MYSNFATSLAAPQDTEEEKVSLGSSYPKIIWLLMKVYKEDSGDARVAAGDESREIPE